ncbi:MAG: hypothetical protein QMD04_00440 [Anaerolineales bacterium]|nr:hypothetical protein [Anaerolineales bacterium]
MNKSGILKTVGIILLVIAAFAGGFTLRGLMLKTTPVPEVEATATPYATVTPAGPTATPTMDASGCVAQTSEAKFFCDTVLATESELYQSALDIGGVNVPQTLAGIVDAHPEVFSELGAKNETYARSMLHIGVGVQDAATYETHDFFTDPSKATSQPVEGVGITDFSLLGGPEFLDAATKGYAYWFFDNTNTRNFFWGSGI